MKDGQFPRGRLAVPSQSGRGDLNPGPPAPEAGALTGLRYAPLTTTTPPLAAGAMRATAMRPEGLEPPTF